MAFNLDHTSSGDLKIQGAHYAFTGNFIFPKPTKSSTAHILTQGFSSINAIDGLYETLTGLLDTISTGNSISLDAYVANQNNSGRALVLNSSSQVDDAVLPNSILNCVYIVSNSGQLILSSSAKKGSIGVTTSTYQTYVLTGLFNNIDNWVPLLDPVANVSSVNQKTGVITISSCDLVGKSDFANGKNESVNIKQLSTGYADCSCLGNLQNESDFQSNLSNNYSTTTQFTDCLNNNYLTTGYVHDCVSKYPKYSETGSIFSLYTPSSSFGNILDCNVGTSAYCIACVNTSGKVDSSTIPFVSLIDTFSISSESDLVTLSTANVGDVAIDYTNKKNYILTVCGDSAYQTLSNWSAFEQTQGSVISVNGNISDNAGNVQFTTNNISGNITGVNEALNIDIKHVVDLVGYTSDGTGKYKNYSEFVSDASGYALTSVFNSISDLKSTTGHIHPFTGITNLNTCVNKIYAFKQGDNINSLNSYSYRLTPENVNTSTGSLMLGKDSKSVNNYEIVHAPGNFSEKGDAQTLELTKALLATQAGWNDVLNLNIDENSMMFITANAVSRAGASFTLEGSVMRATGDVFNEDAFSKNIRSSGTVNSDVRVLPSSDGFVFQVSGQSYWTVNLKTLSLKASSSTGFYWKSTVDNDWYNVSGNWFTTNTFTTHTDGLPTSTSQVKIFGNDGVLIDLDNQNWVQPALIDATNMTGNGYAVCFTSQNNNSFTGTVYGSVEFLGNSHFGV
jgi:hypothetical protein